MQNLFHWNRYSGKSVHEKQFSCIKEKFQYYNTDFFDFLFDIWSVTLVDTDDFKDVWTSITFFLMIYKKILSKQFVSTITYMVFVLIHFNSVQSLKNCFPYLKMTFDKLLAIAEVKFIEQNKPDIRKYVNLTI